MDEKVAHMTSPQLKSVLLAASLLAFAVVTTTAWAAEPQASAASAPKPTPVSSHAQAHKAASAASAISASKAAKPAKPVKLIDINSASRAQLKALPELSDEQIDKLIAARPFLTKTDLVTSKVLPTGVYLQIKRRIIAKQQLPLKLKPQ
jgi:competence protein ComEA